jgi:hypothetical protein
MRVDDVAIIIWHTLLAGSADVVVSAEAAGAAQLAAVLRRGRERRRRGNGADACRQGAQDYRY